MGVSVGSQQRPQLVGSAAAADPTTSAWERRWRRLWHWLFAMTLVLPTVLTLLDGGRPLGWQLATGGIAAAFGAWYAGLVMAHLRWWERPLPMLVYWAGALALFVVLIRRAVIYFFLVYGLIPQAFMLLPGRWAYVAAAGVFVVASTAHWGVGVLTDPGRLTQLVGNLALASAVGLFINALARQSEERRRMAGEIHDTLAQGLTGIVTQLEAAEQALDDQSAGVRRHLDTARRLARESLAEARRSVQALRPQPLEAVQLPEAVAQVAARWAHDTGIAATATTTGAPRPLHPEVEVTLLRAAQEALTNAARHARPSAVSLTLSYMEDLVSLDVHDDGAGFDPTVLRSNGSPGGYGLTAMRERLARLAGTLDLESAPARARRLRSASPSSRQEASRDRPDPPARRRRPSGGPRRAPRNARRAARPGGGRRGGRRGRGGRPRPAPAPRRGPDGPAHAGNGRRRRDPQAAHKLPRRADPGAHHLRHRHRRRAGDRGGRDRLPAQGHASRGAGPRNPRRRAGRGGPRPGGGDQAPWPDARAGPGGGAQRPGAGGARAGRPRRHQPGGGRQAVHQRGDGEDPPAARVREAWRERPDRRGDHRDRARAATPTWLSPRARDRAGASAGRRP